MGHVVNGSYNPLVVWNDTLGIHIFFGVIITIITILIISTNALNITVITRMPTLCKSSGCFLIQLSIVDLMTGVFMGAVAIPSAFLNRWAFGETMCSIVGYCGTLTITLSVNSLALVSIDRYLYVVWPFKYTELMTTKKACIAIAVVWIVNVGFYIIPFCIASWPVELKFHYWEGAYICSFGFENNYPFFMAALGLVFLPGFVVVFICHAMMYFTARKHLRVLKANAGQLQPPPMEASVVRKTTNAFKTVATIITAFCIAYLPKVCYSLSLTVIHQYHIDIRVPTYMSGVVWWIAISNSFMNFFIYSFRNKDFRKYVKKIVQETTDRITDVLSNIRPRGNRVAVQSTHNKQSTKV